MSDQNLSRRNLLALTGASLAIPVAANADDHEEKKPPRKGKLDPAALPLPAAKHGNIKQSLVFWCLNNSKEKWDLEKTCTVAKQLGCPSVELVPPDAWPTLKKHGLTCAIAPNGMPGAPFIKGLNNKAYHEQIFDVTKKTMDAAAEHGVERVIAFSGFKWRDAEDPESGEISLEEGAENTIAGLKELSAYGEKKGITVCIEHLNTRDDTDPMKGHPGYQGDDIDYVADIVRAVGSEHCKILFDIYHVQIMNGDIIRRLKEMKDIIGHIHTAGCPGRNELHINQEINYRACMKALVDMGYEGYVGQEFIPTRNAFVGLHRAVTICDV